MPMNDNQPYVIDYIGVMGKPDMTKAAEEHEHLVRMIKKLIRKKVIQETAKEYEL